MAQQAAKLDAVLAQNLSARVEEAIKKASRSLVPPLLKRALISHACVVFACLALFFTTCLQVLGGEADVLDGPTFDAVDFVNQKFPDEKSLEALDRAIADYDYEIQA